MDILGAKNMGPSNKPKKQNGNFLENVSEDSDSISVIYGDQLPK
jgi:hypothetical protein